MSENEWKRGVEARREKGKRVNRIKWDGGQEMMKNARMNHKRNRQGGEARRGKE